MIYFEEHSSGNQVHGFLIWESLREQVSSILEMASRDAIKLVNPAWTGSWYGRDIYSWKQFGELSFQRWDSGADLVDSMAAKIVGASIPEPSKISRVQRWTDGGGEDFDLDRFQDGMDAFRSTHRRRVCGSQFLAVVVDIGGNCNISSQSLFWRGATAVVLSNLLEAAGYGVEAYVVEGSVRTHDGLGFLCQFTRVKDSGASLNVAEFVNAVSPWFYRIGSFASIAAVPNRRFYSIGGNSTPSLADLKKADPGGKILYAADCFDMDSSIKVIHKLLNSIDADGEI